MQNVLSYVSLQGGKFSDHMGFVSKSVHKTGGSSFQINVFLAVNSEGVCFSSDAWACGV